MNITTIEGASVYSVKRFVATERGNILVDVALCSSANVKDQARALEASAKATNGQGALPASACSGLEGSKIK